MNHIGKPNQLRTHRNYERLADIAFKSHAHGRTPRGIKESDISLARLYSYAFRGQVIGSFSATRRALEALHTSDRFVAAQLSQADQLLADLANRSMDPVASDMRALISTFYFYCTHVSRTIAALDLACELELNAELLRIRNLFVHNIGKITSCNGLHLTRDTGVPELASFTVPNLGITIVPLVYGDQHSWNLAWLDSKNPEVPWHLHSEGVEIHLGFSPLHGCTVLGDARAELRESYAMPIPANTRHGYTNIHKEPHRVPFIFGSLSHGGWGIFFDVVPKPCSLKRLKAVPILDKKLNGSVLLDREIAKLDKHRSSIRYPIILAERTSSIGIGGIELSISQATRRGIKLGLEQFCAVSVVRGQGILEMANQRIEITKHDHFGIPAGLSASITSTGSEPVVLLDAILRPARQARRAKLMQKKLRN